MELYKLFLLPIFQILEAHIKIPLDTIGEKFLDVPLYLICVFIFIIYLIDVIYNRIFDNGG